MFSWVLENPPPANILLISGDQDFAHAMHSLAIRQYNILLAVPNETSHHLLESAASKVWKFREIVFPDEVEKELVELKPRKKSKTSKKGPIPAKTPHPNITEEIQETPNLGVSFPLISQEISVEKGGNGALNNNGTKEESGENGGEIGEKNREIRRINGSISGRIESSNMEEIVGKNGGNLGANGGNLGANGGKQGIPEVEIVGKKSGNGAVFSGKGPEISSLAWDTLRRFLEDAQINKKG